MENVFFFKWVFQTPVVLENVSNIEMTTFNFLLHFDNLPNETFCTWKR